MRDPEPLRTVDVVSGVHVRPGQRCSETPPGGTAPGDTPWLQTASALRALKSQRAVLLPMARTGFGYLCGQGTSQTVSTCRTSASHLPFIFKGRQGVLLLAFRLQKAPHPLPGELLLGGWTSGTFRFTKASHTNMRCPPVKSTLRTENSEVDGTEELPSPQRDDGPIGNSRATFQEEMPRPRWTH